VPEGHHLRVAVSPGYWPHAWPSPEPVTLSLFADGASTLSLPVRSGTARAHAPGPPGPPGDDAPESAVPTSRGRTRTVRRDPTRGMIAIEDRERHDARILATRTRYSTRSVDRWEIAEGDPLSAKVRCERTIKIDRDGWHVRVCTASEMTADADGFHLHERVEAFEDDRPVHSREWDSTVPRNGV
jgi:hypothetical protein